MLHFTSIKLHCAKVLPLKCWRRQEIVVLIVAKANNIVCKTVPTRRLLVTNESSTIRCATRLAEQASISGHGGDFRTGDWHRQVVTRVKSLSNFCNIQTKRLENRNCWRPTNSKPSCDFRPCFLVVGVLICWKMSCFFGGWHFLISYYFTMDVDDDEQSMLIYSDSSSTNSKECNIAMIASIVSVHHTNNIFGFLSVLENEMDEEDSHISWHSLLSESTRRVK